MSVVVVSFRPTTYRERWLAEKIQPRRGIKTGLRYNCIGGLKLEDKYIAAFCT